MMLLSFPKIPIYKNLQIITIPKILMSLIHNKLMSDKDQLLAVIAKIDSMLLLDYMTDPVRQELTDMKTTLVAVSNNLS